MAEQTRLAREAFSRGEYARAAELFSEAVPLETRRAELVSLLQNRSMCFAALGRNESVRARPIVGAQAAEKTPPPFRAQALADAEKSVELASGLEGDDTAKAIALGKGLYRVSKALLALGRFDDALDSIARAQGVLVRGGIPSELYRAVALEQLTELACRAARAAFQRSREAEALSAAAENSSLGAVAAPEDPRPPPSASASWEDRHSPRQTEPTLSPSQSVAAAVARARAVLGVESGAGREQLRRAFLRQVMDAHPDKGGSPESFIELYDAYSTLAQHYP